MGTYKNRIIAISGDPASGKGTVAKELESLYRTQGLRTHIISVGEVFRKLAIKEYKNMFPDSEPSVEEINSNPNFAQKLKEIDFTIDREIEKIGKEINSKDRPGEIFIIDSRLAWKMIPESFAVRLTVDKETAGERVFNDPKRGAEDQYTSLEEAIKDTASRREEEIKRYLEGYGVDLTDPNNFHLIIGTTLANISDIAHTIQVCEECSRKGTPFCKTWASPELFYPTQSIRDTFEPQIFGSNLTFEELAQSIKKKGIYPNEPIRSITITDSPYQFVSDGHHRVFASIWIGNTLIPYEAEANLEEAAVDSRGLSIIYDHEMRREDRSEFTYKQYPRKDDRVNPHDDLRGE